MTEEVFETVPTFRPTLEEMHDFDKYLVHLHQVHECDKVGLTKIIPPKEWDWNPTMEQARGMRVKSPIEQCVTGRSGAYNVCNIVRSDLLLQEYEAIALKQPGSPEDADFADLFQIERKFWKSLTTTSAPPLYGSDVEGTLFADANVPFNVNHLDCCLKKSGVAIPGVTNPMMYVGMWRSFFPFHTEDVNMFSISVMHVGKPKFWYGIPPEYTTRVQNLARSTWPSESSKCPEIMRHKTMLFSPTRLENSGIPFVRAVQREREIIITWPSCFHGGFNSGLNVAEAVNFCPKGLIDLFLESARLAGFCKCHPEAVVIDVRWLEAQLQQNVLEEEWIQCEECEKWRKLPVGNSVENAVGGEGKRWTCALNTWDPEHATCEAEEETTQALPYPPVEELHDNPIKVKVGEKVELLMDENEWCTVRIESIIDGYARLHRAGTLGMDDIWVNLRSMRIRKPRQQQQQTTATMTTVAPVVKTEDKPAKRIKTATAVPPEDAKEAGMKRRTATREWLAKHIDQVREVFNSQVRTQPILECIKSDKQQWQLPADYGKLSGVKGLRTVEQNFEVIFRAISISQKLVGVPCVFKDPRDAHEVHQKLTALFESIEQEEQQ